ncbi:MAG: type II secretion system GspH family protein [Blautia sp.]|nr:type II secretion system GspH family protein [Blautia sp.]
MRKSRQRKHMGFTLVELLVSITILAVVLAIGMGFVVRAVGIYNRGSRESSLQNEAQLTMTRLQSLIVNASHGCSVTDPAGGLPGGGGAPSTLTGKDLFVYNRKEIGGGSYVQGQYDIVHIYQEGSRLLYCHRTYSLDASGTSSLTADKVNPEILSEFIKDFNVDLTNLIDKNAVDIQVDFENMDKSYTTGNTFLLRNGVVKKADGSADDYFRQDAEADRQQSITAISITPADVYVWQGTSLPNPFSISATVDGQTKTGAQVIWNVKSPEGVDASIGRTSGLIKVGDNVTGDITVEATSLSSINAAMGDTTKYVSATATVHIKSFDGGATLTQPQPQSEDNHKIYEAVFAANGNNLEKDVDMAGMPFVAAGSTVTATFEKLPEESGPTSLRWRVKVRRPADYVNKSYTLVVGYTLNGKVQTAQVDNIIFTPSIVEEGAEITAVRLMDTTDNIVYDATGSTQTRANRGGTKNLEMQVMYKGGASWVPMEAAEWGITADNPSIVVSEGVSGYELKLGVKDYTKKVSVNLTTFYTDTTGKSQPGPGVILSFEPVRLRLASVTGSQTRFPVTRGETDTMSFVIENLDGGTLCLADGDAGSRSSIYLAISGAEASVTVASGQTQSKTFHFGVRTSDGNVLDGISCDLTFVPGEANVFTDANGNRTNLFLPRATDLTSYSSQLSTPSGSETAVLFTVSGKQIVYGTKNSKYHVVYDGKGYTYNSTWRGWMPD